MTRSRYRIFDDAYPHFLTCTIVGWQAVFTWPEAVQIVFGSWNFLKKEKGFHLYAYVVLENHLHLIGSAPELSGAIKSFKMYTARQIIDLLESQGDQGSSPPASSAEAAAQDRERLSGLGGGKYAEIDR
jgi:hypothetical protein